MLIAQDNSTAFPLQLTVSRDGFGGVTGLSPTVALRDATGTTNYIDWDDLVMKSSGWVTKYASMTETERGTYVREMDVATIGFTEGTLLSAEFHFETGSTKGDTTEIVAIVNNLEAIPTPQGVADALMLAPVAGAPAGSSVNGHLDQLVSEIGVGVVSAILTDTHEIQGTVSTNLNATVSSRAVPGDAMTLTPAERTAIVDAVWDEVIDSTAHFTSSTTGEALTLIKGMVQNQFMLDSTEYNPSGLLTSGRIRIFSTKAEVEAATDEGTDEGEIATFTVTTEAEATATQAKVYKSVRDS
jgi:hypothetical protein